MDQRAYRDAISRNIEANNTLSPFAKEVFLQKIINYNYRRYKLDDILIDSEKRDAISNAAIKEIQDTKKSFNKKLADVSTNNLDAIYRIVDEFNNTYKFYVSHVFSHATKKVLADFNLDLYQSIDFATLEPTPAIIAKMRNIVLVN